MASPEHDLQVIVTRFLTIAMPPEIVWTAVDHGAGKMSARSAGQRKARGVKRGQADYRFVLPPHGRSAEIELKVKGTYQSTAQEAWEAGIEASGGLYRVCRSLGEVELALLDWGVRLRATAIT